MKKALLFFLLLLTLSGARAQTFNPALATMLQDTLTTYVGLISNIKGMSAAVYIPGQGTWTGAAGVSYTGQPITTDMRFGIASNTKLFVSTTMLMLAEDGILTLNDPVSMWLPSYPNVNPNITIRQLLSHQSGVSDPIFVSPLMDTINANPTRVFTPQDVLSYLQAPQFAPGAGYYYSNVNYILAGMIAESATGFHISQLIRDSILTPLNMDSTFYDVEETEIGVLAHRWWNTVDYNDTSRVGINSAGGAAGSLFTTAAEEAQWIHAVLSGQLLNQNSMNELTNFRTINANYDYGLGLSRETTNGVTYWGHGGSIWGYKSKTIYDTCSTVSVVGLANSFPAGMDGVVFLLYRVVLNHIPGGCNAVLSGQNTVCQNTNGVVYTVTPIPGATSYQWTLPSGATGVSATNTITVNYGAAAMSGDIIVRGVNMYGAGAFATLSVTVNPTPPTPTINVNGNQLTSSSPVGNQWYNLLGMMVGETNQVLNALAADDYYVIVTLNGCSSDTSAHVIITGIDAVNNESVLFYPNPATNEVTLMSAGEFDVEVYDISGRMVANKSGNHDSCELDLLDWDSGVYMVKLIRGSESSVVKLVKE